MNTNNKDNDDTPVEEIKIDHEWEKVSTLTLLLGNEQKEDGDNTDIYKRGDPAYFILHDKITFLKIDAETHSQTKLEHIPKMSVIWHGCDNYYNLTIRNTANTDSASKITEFGPDIKDKDKIADVICLEKSDMRWISPDGQIIIQRRQLNYHIYNRTK